jgi:thiamine pyrophosphate-dependent acetolactate synthase large subunit-like protein
MTGAELIAKALAAEGLRYFFNLPGNGVYPMLDPLVDYDIQYVLGLHESSVVFMADGYARASGKVPFVNLYMVPGTANGLAGVYTAYRDRVPMVVTSTQQTVPIVGRDAYASAPDLLGMVRQFTKWAWEVPVVERLPEAIHRAFKLAATPPQGPVFLAFPFDLFPAAATRPLNEPTRPSAVPSFGAPPAEAIRAIADRLMDATGILFVCGKDVVACGAVGDVEALAREVGAAVVSEPWAGVVAFPTPHAHGFGEYTREIFERLAPTLVFGIGARMFVEAIGVPEKAFPEGTRVVTVGLDPGDLGRHVAAEVSGVGDVRLAVQAIREACRGRVDAARRAARMAVLDAYQRESRAALEAALEEHYHNDPMSLARLATELNKVISADTVIVEHGTTSTPVLMNYLRVPDPGNIFATGGSVQGWGMPAAIGAQMGRPDHRVLAIVGDGGFTFTCQALWSASRYRVPVTIVVINNGGYRSMRAGVLRQAKRSAEKGVNFGFDFEVDVGHAARAFGVDARRVSDPAHVADAVRAGLRGDAPNVVEVVISPNPFPWI